MIPVMSKQKQDNLDFIPMKKIGLGIPKKLAEFQYRREKWPLH